MKSSRSTSHMGGGKKKSSSKKHPHEMHIKRAHSGGFIVTHHHKMGDDGAMPETEDHVLPDTAALQAHVGDNMGDQPPAEPPASMAQAGPGAAGPAGGGGLPQVGM